MKKELQYIIGENLKKIRKERSMTREAVAEAAGISVTFYANLESGNRMMSILTLCKLAEILQVSTDALLKTDSYGSHVGNIVKILENQPQEMVGFVEKMTYLCVESYENGPHS